MPSRMIRRCVTFEAKPHCGIISATQAEGALSDDEMASLIRDIGVERIMCGSDSRFVDPAPGHPATIEVELHGQGEGGDLS